MGWIQKLLLATLASVALLAVLFAALFLWWAKGTTEWVCSKGEVPVYTTGDPQGGLFCAPANYKLQDDEAFDPLGNRPLGECPRNWVTVHNPKWENSVRSQTDCWRANKPLPKEAVEEGWVLPDD